MMKSKRPDGGISVSPHPISFNVGIMLEPWEKMNVFIRATVHFHQQPGLLIVGNSGSGKTHLETYILGQLAGQKAVELFLSDYKGIDFSFAKGCTRYRGHLDVSENLDAVHNILQERMEKGLPYYHPVIAVFDEWSGYLESVPKKEGDNAKAKLFSLLALGRGVSIYCIVCQQRGDAEWLKGRDNLGNLVGLGSLSDVAKSMMFHEEKELIRPLGRGQGYLKTDGKPLREIIVPKIRDIVHTREAISLALDRPFT